MMTDPAQVARSRGKRIIQKELGELRTFSSQAAHTDQGINEEEFFELVSRNLLKGIRSEVSNIFGATKAAHMLNPFKKNG